MPGLPDSDLWFAAYLIVILRKAESSLEMAGICDVPLRLHDGKVFATDVQAPRTRRFITVLWTLACSRC